MLRRVYLFADLDAELLDEVAEGMRETEAEPGRWLCFHGEPAERFYLVMEGEVALLRSSEDGDEMIVALVGPGELFGEELVFLDDAEHPLSARTLGPSRVAAFDRRAFRSVLERRPRLLFEILHTLYRRNAILLDEIERVTI